MNSTPPSLHIYSIYTSYTWSMSPVPACCLQVSPRACHATVRSASLLLLVHGGQHEGDVGGEEVVHLVAEACLAEESASPHQVADGHVEVVGATAPVGDLGERVGSQHLLFVCVCVKVER